MIKKVTLLNERSISEEASIDKSSEKALDQMRERLQNEVEFLSKAALLMSFLKQFPDVRVTEAIKANFGPDSYTIKRKSKKYRVYHVHGGLYIHEEDQL